MTYFVHTLFDPNGRTDPRWNVCRDGKNGQREVVAAWTNGAKAEAHVGVLNNIVRSAAVPVEVLHSIVIAVANMQRDVEQGRVNADPAEVSEREARLGGAIEMALSVGATNPVILRYAYAAFGRIIGWRVGTALGYSTEQLTDWTDDFVEFDLSNQFRPEAV